LGRVLSLRDLVLGSLELAAVIAAVTLTCAVIRQYLTVERLVRELQREVEDPVRREPRGERQQPLE
jgi:hypothetical protein